MNPTLFTLVCSRKHLAEVPRALPVRASGLVGSSGLEPPTSRLSGARSNQLSYEPISVSRNAPVSVLLFLATLYGGDEGVRTLDPLLAGQVLSQLSYTPVCLYPSSFLFK